MSRERSDTWHEMRRIHAKYKKPGDPGIKHRPDEQHCWCKPCWEARMNPKRTLRENVMAGLVILSLPITFPLAMVIVIPVSIYMGLVWEDIFGTNIYGDPPDC